ncbi:ankyrin [Penicillium waksmanii]|uniref:ankyrin n=1 Tax=Penicillium waksmanii TaxID=69791 RepID=UPI002547C98C|nr:ankyrin [Penicillium waksmanii]KAJ5988210.1 ankyrin [Penicillium waksmanii]
MSDPKGYTVEPDPLSPADNNAYACGRIGRHMVVIAVLPDGEYGVSSAANTNGSTLEPGLYGINGRETVKYNLCLKTPYRRTFETNMLDTRIVIILG